MTCVDSTGLTDQLNCLRMCYDNTTCKQAGSWITAACFLMTCKEMHSIKNNYYYHYYCSILPAPANGSRKTTCNDWQTPTYRIRIQASSAKVCKPILSTWATFSRCRIQTDSDIVEEKTDQALITDEPTYSKPASLWDVVKSPHTIATTMNDNAKPCLRLGPNAFVLCFNFHDSNKTKIIIITTIRSTPKIQKTKPTPKKTQPSLSNFHKKKQPQINI